MIPKISVIIPVYNVEKYLRQCLDSVISQTLREIEIIAVNDGSPDNSLSILRGYADKDDRIKIIDKKNEGVGKARNDGIKAATGEFIAFMDSDDYYPSEDVLSSLYEAAINNNVKIAGGTRNALLTDGSVEKIRKSAEEFNCVFSSFGLTDYSDYQYDYGFTQFIYNRKMLIDNDIFFPLYKRFQDPPFFVRAMIASGSFYMTDVNSYCYRMVPSEVKYSARSTLDFLCGLSDNIIVSRENNLSKLHYLSAMRLLYGGSFMAIRNFESPEILKIFEKIISTMNLIDVDWLKSEGFSIPDPFVPEVFSYAVSATNKYEKLRQNKALKFASKIIGK